MKLRHTFVVFVMAIALLTGCSIDMLNGLSGGGKNSGAVDKDSLMKQAKIICDTISAGYISMYMSKEYMYEAANLDEKAAETKDVLKAVQEAKDPIDRATILVESNKSDTKEVEADLQKIDYNNQTAKKNVKESAIQAVVAFGYDTYAAKNMDSFISSVSKAISADPVGMMDLKPYLQLAQKAAPLVPQQLTDLTTMVKHYSRYSKDKSITNVSKSEMDKAKAENSKQAPDAQSQDSDFDSMTGDTATS